MSGCGFRELKVIVGGRTYSNAILLQPIQADKSQVTIGLHQAGEAVFSPFHDFRFIGGDIQRRFAAATSDQQ